MDAITQAESTWHIKLKKVGRNEWVGPCPLGCNYQGEDRFHVFTDGDPRFWCRACGQKGFMNALDGRKPTAEELLEARVRRLERQQQEHERRLSALERMARCQDHIQYHNLLTDEHIEWWDGQGINQDSILEYRLGFCPRCPTDREGSPSYTIPVVNSGQLQNIRHRLKFTNGGGKYRPHMAGLGLQLFNADFLQDAIEIVVIEGAKKSVVLSQYGIPSVAVMGKRSFRREWLEWFDGVETVYIALDPDARESGERLAGLFGDRGRFVDLPVKADDFFYIHNGTPDDFRGYLKCARPT